MANNPTDGPDNDFLEQILGIQTFAGGDPNMAVSAAGSPMGLQLNSGDASSHLAAAAGLYQQHTFPLGLSLEQGSGGFLRPDEAVGHMKRSREDQNVYLGQPMHSPAPIGPHPPAVRPRVRARRGQATDPHSIAERLRRERIAERIRALQELVPSVNKTDRAAMLDEVVEYVKFLRLQVKDITKSTDEINLTSKNPPLLHRLGGAGAVAPLVTDIPISSVEEEGSEGGRNQPAWERWSNDGTEQQVAKLMEDNVGAAMQFLQSKQLCIMPVSLAAAIYHTQPSDASPNSSIVKPESNPP
ncbi:hypothetical protein V2J09_000404 [Rumex salicifolius]